MTDPSDIEKRFSERLQSRAAEEKAFQTESMAAGSTALKPVVDALAGLTAALTKSSAHGQIRQEGPHLNEFGTYEIMYVLEHSSGRQQVLQFSYGPTLGGGRSLFAEGLGLDAYKKLVPEKADEGFQFGSQRTFSEPVRIEPDRVSLLAREVERVVTEFFVGR